MKKPIRPTRKSADPAAPRLRGGGKNRPSRAPRSVQNNPDRRDADHRDTNRQDTDRRGADRPKPRAFDNNRPAPRSFDNDRPAPRSFGNDRPAPRSFGNDRPRPTRSAFNNDRRNADPARPRSFGSDRRDAGPPKPRGDYGNDRPAPRNAGNDQARAGFNSDRRNADPARPRTFDNDRPRPERSAPKGNQRSFDRDRPQGDDRPRPARSNFDNDRRNADPARPRPFDNDRPRPARAGFDNDRSRPRPFDNDRSRPRPVDNARPRPVDNDRRPFDNAQPRPARNGYGSRDADRPSRPSRPYDSNRRDINPRDADRPAPRGDRRDADHRGTDRPSPPSARSDFKRSAPRAPFSPDRREAGPPDQRSSNDRPDRRQPADRGDAPGRTKPTPDYDLPRGGKPARRDAEATPEAEGPVRLNRYIANAGVCSRRDADTLIAAGEIQVNGTVVTEMGFQVQPGDVVKYGGRSLSREKPVYVLLNKPKDFLTTTEDPEERRTVMQLVANACDQRIYPVGRLDRNTTGLLLLTNDGELAEKLAHPSHEIKKVYQVELDKPFLEIDFQKVLDGITLEDGEIKVDDLGIVTPDAMVVGVELHSGRNRVVRRIFEHLGYEVIRLDRTVYAGLTKKDLPRGKWRFLTEKEVIKLKFFA